MEDTFLMVMFSGVKWSLTFILCSFKLLIYGIVFFIWIVCVVILCQVKKKNYIKQEKMFDERNMFIDEKNICDLSSLMILKFDNF